MKILFVSSEASPLAKVGGLADVVGSLPRALRALGHDVRVVIPQYAGLEKYSLTSIISNLRVSIDNELVGLNIAEVNTLPVYLVKNQRYFATREVYFHDLDRFYFFSRAIFEMLPELDWQPEVVHCHDWLTALVVMWQKLADQPYKHLFSIHNLAYQGFFDGSFRHSSELNQVWENAQNGSPPIVHTFMAQAVLRADLVTTVSQTYAREITTPEYGVGMDALLRYRQDRLMGIVNGIQLENWNPAADPALPYHYSPDELRNRSLIKAALQKTAGLPAESEIPLIGMVTRLDEQKGLDILGQGIDRMLTETGAQIIILGRGRDNYENMAREISRRYPRQAASLIAFDEPAAHLVYAGSDIFLMPSRFEPCGLGQLIAMRYGGVPVVRHTGGLVDTVPAFNSDLTRGNGFVFHDYTAEGLIGAVKQAVKAYKNKDQWQKAVNRLMKLDFSWDASAREYEKAYRRVIGG